MTGEPDSTALGGYTLLRPLAHGGMAELFLARAHASDRLVALKLLSGARAADAETRAMFVDEARVSMLLRHPNIAAVHDVALEGETPYLALEYVRGADLRELLGAAARADRAIPYAASLAIVIGAAAGLDHAHRRCDAHGRPLRVVHRDVSLSNIMVGYDGAVKVVDFGIASTALRTVHTSPGVVRGKASYMAPEQCVGDAVDHRTDVFALGVVLYELTTGARCFDGKTDFDRMLAVVRGDYVAPTLIVGGYPPELEAIVHTALASDPARRFPSAAAMADALERVARGRGWTAGRAAIVEVMRALLTDERAPSARHDDDALTDDDAPTRGCRPLPRRATARVLAA